MAPRTPIHAFLEFLTSAPHDILSKPLAAFPQPLSKQRTALREEWILSQWLSSILGKNTGRAGDRTSDLLFSSPQISICRKFQYNNSKTVVGVRDSNIPTFCTQTESQTPIYPKNITFERVWCSRVQVLADISIRLDSSVVESRNGIPETLVPNPGRARYFSSPVTFGA